MRKRGTGKHLWLVAVAAAFAVMAYAGLALAASPPIIGQIDDTFSAPTYTIDQGEVAQLQVTGNEHNATARTNGPDKMALFRSATITGGSTTVNGTQYLPAGDYMFFCTIHPTTMQATLHVSASGTPLARPQVSWMKLKTNSLTKAIKKGIWITNTPTTRIEGVTLTAKLGKATIGKKTVTLLEGWNSDLIKLSKAGKSKLRKKSQAKVSVTADVPFGSPITAKGKLK